VYVSRATRTAIKSSGKPVIYSKESNKFGLTILKANRNSVPSFFSKAVRFRERELLNTGVFTGERMKVGRKSIDKL
jgi:hypothetical protein